METTTVAKISGVVLTTLVYGGVTYWLTNRDIPETYQDEFDSAYVWTGQKFIKVPRTKTNFGKGQTFLAGAAFGYLALMGGLYYLNSLKIPSIYDEAKVYEERLLDLAQYPTNSFVHFAEHRNIIKRLRTDFSFVDFLDELIGLEEDNEGSIYLSFKERQTIRDAFLQGLDIFRVNGLSQHQENDYYALTTTNTAQ